MDEARLQEIVMRLRALESELVHLVELSASSSKPVSLDEPIGRLTRVDALQQQAMSLAGRSGHQARLSMVRQALQRAEEGSYGICMGCDEPISEVRLDARPEATTCVECQERAEVRRR